MELKGSEAPFTYDICLKIKKFNPLLQNTKDCVRLCQNHPLPFLAGMICEQSLKVM